PGAAARAADPRRGRPPGGMLMKPVWIKYYGLIPMTRFGYLIALLVAGVFAVAAVLAGGISALMPPLATMWARRTRRPPHRGPAIGVAQLGVGDHPRVPRRPGHRHLLPSPHLREEGGGGEGAPRRGVGPPRRRTAGHPSTAGDTRPGRRAPAAGSPPPPGRLM